MINFTNLEEVKMAYPVDSYICLPDRVIQITGYYFDTKNWWPANIAEGKALTEDGITNISIPIKKNIY